MLKRILNEAEAQVVLCLDSNVTRSKRNGHNKNCFAGGISMVERNVSS